MKRINFQPAKWNKKKVFLSDPFWFMKNNLSIGSCNIENSETKVSFKHFGEFSSFLGNGTFHEKDEKYFYIPK